MNNVTIVRSHKRTSVGIQVLSNTSVKVTIPFFLPKFYVSKILEQKEDWIRSKQQQILARQANTIKKEKGQYLYLGKSYQLQERPGQKEMIEVSDKLYVGSANQKFIKTYLMS